MSTTPRETAIPQPNARADLRALFLALATLALYAASCLLENALYRNGLNGPAPFLGPAAAPDRLLLAQQLIGYVAIISLLFWIYVRILSMCERGELAGRGTRLIVLVAPVIANLLLLWWLPRLSQDIFSYVAQGLLGHIYGDNPLLQAPSVVQSSPFASQLAAFNWRPVTIVSPYGILWTRLEMASVHLARGNVLLAVVLLKSVAVLASLGSAALIWWIVGRIAPAMQFRATLAYLWNPLIIMDLAGSGHNDALMLFFSLLALAAVLRSDGAASGVAQFFGVITKYVCVLFLPAQLACLWWQKRSAARFALMVCVALAICAFIAALLYAPLWHGIRSFDGLLKRAAPVSSASFFGIVDWILRRSPLHAAAGQITLIVAGLPLLAVLAWSVVSVRTAEDLARACAWISLVFTLVTCPDYWPQYACLPVAWIIVGEMRRLFWLALLLSACARLIAPLDIIREHGLATMHVSKGLMTGVGSLVPLVALLIWLGTRVRTAPTEHA